MKITIQKVEPGINRDSKLILRIFFADCNYSMEVGAIPEVLKRIEAAQGYEHQEPRFFEKTPL